MANSGWKEIGLENSNWQNDWAHTTLKVIQQVSNKQGWRLYPNDTAPREDLESYLTVEAQKIANKYQPAWNAKDPESYWAGYLQKILTDTSRYHWSEWINTKSTQPGYETAKQANSGWAKIEALLAKDDQVMQTQPRMTNLQGERLPTPEDHYLRCETLEERLATLDREPLKELTICIEEECQQQISSRNRCERHAVLHKSQWDQGERCKEPLCPDLAVTRGWCPKHYNTAYARARRTGQQWDCKPAAPTHCTVKDCNKPHDSLGLCKTHYGTYRQSLKPPCTEQGCDKKQISRGLCTKHYQRMRKGLL